LKSVNDDDCIDHIDHIGCDGSTGSVFGVDQRPLTTNLVLEPAAVAVGSRINPIENQLISYGNE